MSQPDLFTQCGGSIVNLPLIVTAARRTDPQTSHDAAHAAAVLAAKHQRLILSALKQGPAGVDGIAARCSLTGHQAGKRVTDMQRLGLIELTGRLVKSTSGRAQREWRVAG